MRHRSSPAGTGSDRRRTMLRRSPVIACPGATEERVGPDVHVQQISRAWPLLRTNCALPVRGARERPWRRKITWTWSAARHQALPLVRHRRRDAVAPPCAARGPTRWAVEVTLRGPVVHTRATSGMSAVVSGHAAREGQVRPGCGCIGQTPDHRSEPGLGDSDLGSGGRIVVTAA
jgi:hypothetical protein